MTTRAYIGIGANLGEAFSTVVYACRLVAQMGSQASISSIYFSDAVGGPPAPPYYNAVVGISTAWRADDLLGNLLRLEARFGRFRRQRWGPRLLDLDLLLYDHCQMQTPQLTLPHPRLVQRRFVLEPLSEIAPDLMVGPEQPIQQALLHVQSQRVFKVSCKS